RASPSCRPHRLSRINSRRGGRPRGFVRVDFRKDRFGAGRGWRVEGPVPRRLRRRRGRTCDAEVCTKHRERKAGGTLRPFRCSRNLASTMAPRILIVDDNTELVGLLSGAFEEAGYEVLQASRGRQALERAKADRPHAAVVDVLLPDLMGYE